MPRIMSQVLSRISTWLGDVSAIPLHAIRWTTSDWYLSDQRASCRYKAAVKFHTACTSPASACWQSATSATRHPAPETLSYTCYHTLFPRDTQLHLLPYSLSQRHSAIPATLSYSCHLIACPARLGTYKPEPEGGRSGRWLTGTCSSGLEDLHTTEER